jgi:HSP20 family protein
MAISRWSPVGELASLHTAVDRLFSDFFGGSALEPDMTGSPTAWYLPLDIIDTENAYEVKAAVPGFTPEEVEVTFSDGVLNVTAQHREDKTTKDGTYLRRELRLGNYARSVQLPGGVRPDDIKARFDSGMLTVEIPKAAKPQPVKIQISGKTEKK